MTNEEAYKVLEKACANRMVSQPAINAASEINEANAALAVAKEAMFSAPVEIPKPDKGGKEDADPEGKSPSNT